MESHVVTHLAGSNYRNNVIVLAGINASGKTTALKLINFVLDVFVTGKSLNPNQALMDLFREQVEVKAHFSYESKLFRIHSVINKMQSKTEKRFVFGEESFWGTELNSRITKADFLSFDEISKEDHRSNLDSAQSRFLKDDDSMIPALIASETDNSVTDVLSAESNMLHESYVMYNAIPKPIFAYFDESIETIELVDVDEVIKGKAGDKLSLKFYGAEAVVIDPTQLEHYLSSGTIRGLGILTLVMISLWRGGYLLIDEIENHFNKVIVENIISFFQSDLNRKGATLIFSTHYSEILDSVQRRDAIKVLKKDVSGIEINSLVALLSSSKKDRSDIKSSDLILSGIFDTAPSYDAFLAVRKLMRFYAEDVDGIEL